MRTIMAAALALVTFGALEAQAGTYWKCMGPSYACSEPAKKRTATYSKPKKAYKAKKSSQSKSAGYAKPKKKKPKTSYSAKSYGGSAYQSGIASYYWQPQRVASGGWFNPNAMTAAHKTLPFGTRVRVTHQGNGRSVVVRINDRGPFIKGRIIDLSKAAAGKIGMQGSGIARVKIQILGKA